MSKSKWQMSNKIQNLKLKFLVYRHHIKPILVIYRHHIPESDLSAASLVISAGMEQINLGVVAVATMSKFICEWWPRLANWRVLGVRFWNVMSIRGARD